MLDGGRSKPPSKGLLLSYCSAICRSSRSCRSRVSVIQNGLVADLLEGDLELYTTVLCTTGLGLVVSDRYIRTVADSCQTLEVNTLSDEVVTNGVSTLVGQLFIQIVRTGVIGVTLNLNDIILVLDEDCSNLVEQRVRFLLDVSLTGLELDTLHSLLEQVANLALNVEVWDTKYRVSLNDMLFKEKEENKPQKQEKTVKKPEVQKNKIMQKTDDWLTREEIVDILSQDERFVDIDGWDRLIKRVVKHGVSITEYRLFNNQSVLCVHKDNIEKVARTLLQIIQEDLARTEKKAQQQNAEIKTEGSKQKPIKLKNNKQSKVVHIEKYIQRSAWKGICSSCNDGTNLLQSMLESVSKINTDFTKQKHGDPVQYIDENGKECSLADIRVKSGKAAAQRLGVSGKDNKRRVIWTYNPEDNIMVAIDFFVSHGKGKLEDTYNKIAIPNAAKGYLMDGKTFVDKNLVKSGDFLKVSDLLDDIKSDKTDNYAEQEELLEPAQDQQEIEVVQDDENVVVGNQDLIAETPVISQEKEPKQPQAPVQNLDVNKEANHYRPRRCYSLVDVKLEEARIQSLIKSLDEEIRRLSREMCHQQNPNEQLKIANNIKELIKQKIRCIGK